MINSPKRSNGTLVAAAVVALGLACGRQPTPENSAPSYLVNGTDVPVSQIPMTGAVSIQSGGCSGTLVTPWWVLTAQHCGVQTGWSVDIPFAPESNTHSRVAQVYPMPGYVEYCGSPRDIEVLRLASPIYLLKSDGHTWDFYSRDLDRDEVPSPPSGSLVDTYAYGCSDPDINVACEGYNVQRFGKFFTNSHGQTFDFDGPPGTPYASTYANHGDSGAGLLRPSFGAITQSSAYKLAGVLSCGDASYGVAVSWSSFAWFFDTIISPSEFTRFNSPAQIMAASAIRI